MLKNNALNHQSHEIGPGIPQPFGATGSEFGVNFSLYSPAEEVSLFIYKVGHSVPFLSIMLDPKQHRTGEIWHISIKGLPTDFGYSWKIGDTIVSDPFAKGIASPKKWKQKCSTINNFCISRYLSPRSFDWQGVEKPNLPVNELIVYEMHVRGFTHDSSSKVKERGTYLGLIEKIPHLLELGINAVELLPIYEFDEMANHRINPLTGETLCDYWGYNPVEFFCPMKRYSTAKTIDSPMMEFKTLVRELHKNGIEVILDVVYNHTGEGNGDGPCISFKGIDKTGYYLIDNQNKLSNYTGTGNTVACNRDPGFSLILASLRHFAQDYQVDGFRFDLASILTRGDDGEPLEDPPILKAIANDPILKSVKLISEAWDAAGLYQVGQFPKWGDWLEWNGKFRDVVRRFIKGTDGYAGSFATALCGSEDLYRGHPRQATHSINFVTCHDGFSLYDLVSYENKYNESNGEYNNDGLSNNDSWNCGAEGPSEDPAINKLREQQMRNHILALLLSLGIPMLLMGDEYAQSHEGNNNSWCQDSKLTWFDWKAMQERKDDLFRFIKKSIAFRKAHPELKRIEFLTDKEISWHGVKPYEPDWGHHSRLVAYSRTLHSNTQVFVAFYPNELPLNIELPPLENGQEWRRLVDTSLDSPNDFVDTPEELADSQNYQLNPYSTIVLIAGDLLSS